MHPLGSRRLLAPPGRPAARLRGRHHRHTVRGRRLIDLFTLPDPPLVDRAAGIALRAWAAADAPALTAAWAVPDIAAQATVPAGGAERWIDGAEVRREVGLSLDLVVGPLDGEEVWGEVGLAALRLTSGGSERTEVEIGWWVLPAHRGRGVATAAAGLLAGWAMTHLGAPRIVARIDRGATTSEAVATAIGLHRLAPLDATRDLWVVHEVPDTS